MNNKDKILKYIAMHHSFYLCDDCLSKVLGINPRQQVNQICRKLMVNNEIVREIGKCSNCCKDKLLNKVK